MEHHSQSASLSPDRAERTISSVMTFRLLRADSSCPSQAMMLKRSRVQEEHIRLGERPWEVCPPSSSV